MDMFYRYCALVIMILKFYPVPSIHSQSQVPVYCALFPFPCSNLSLLDFKCESEAKSN